MEKGENLGDLPQLPPEMLFSIFKCLGPMELSTLRGVSDALRDKVDEYVSTLLRLNQLFDANRMSDMSLVPADALRLWSVGDLSLDARSFDFEDQYDHIFRRVNESAFARSAIAEALGQILDDVGNPRIELMLHRAFLENYITARLNEGRFIDATTRAALPADTPVRTVLTGWRDGTVIWRDHSQ